MKERVRFTWRETISLVFNGDAYELVTWSHVEQLLSVTTPSGKRSAIRRDLPSAVYCDLLEGQCARNLIPIKRHDVHFLPPGFPGHIRHPMSIRRELRIIGCTLSVDKHARLTVREGQNPDFSPVPRDDLSLHTQQEFSIPGPVRGPQHRISVLGLSQQLFLARAAGRLTIDSRRHFPPRRNVEDDFASVGRPSGCALIH